jgi:Zn-dependent peptidase ImmA (M78 family)|tara:strand:- start:657 stop:974 length:318 start_codon:yes stop_codon:yes gene_type:complete
MIKKIRVGATTYKVRKKKLGSIWGYTDFEEEKIFIDSRAKDRQQVSTLLHEALHAMIAEYGINYTLDHNQDESLVRTLESGIVQLILRNKEFTEELVASLEYDEC